MVTRWDVELFELFQRDEKQKKLNERMYNEK